MQRLIRFFIVSVFLNASLQASAQLQPSPDQLVKGPATPSTSIFPANNTDTFAVIERDTSFMQINTRLKAAAIRFKEKIAGLDAYVQSNNFNAEYCFLVDMSIPSGKNRFFVYNIKKGAVELSSLVSHGKGSYKKGCNDILTFSNMPNSNATSVGKYKIGNPYYGTYGLSYKLYGLDSTNNKAFERAIVLHSDSYVPESEIYPYPLYQSAGCPVVSPSILSLLGKYIKTSDKPILLWVYN